jgi:hypothetical protein
VRPANSGGGVGGAAASFSRMGNTDSNRAISIRSVAFVS